MTTIWNRLKTRSTLWLAGGLGATIAAALNAFEMNNPVGYVLYTATAHISLYMAGRTHDK